MPLAQSLLPEFDHEMATTRKLLARTPEDRQDFKPHPKSMSLAALALHLATLPTWGSATMTRTEFDANPVGGPPFPRPEWAGRDALLATFDAAVRGARDAIASASDADLMVPWALKNAGTTIFSLPRIAVLRSFVLSHTIHHRGQFSVYLRLLDVAVPSIYGPSADEPN